MFLTQSKPKQTQGSDVYAGTSFDQIYAQKFGDATPIPSMQLCIENVDQAGGCSYNYSCVYTDTISWATPEDPLPMIRDPRAVFDQLFGVGATPEARRARRKDDQSILDWVTESVADLRRKLGPADRARLADYLDDVREIERRIQKVEQSNQTGEPRELPGAPVGVPDSFEEHVKLMFDLQAVAFAADTTRIFSFKFSRDVSNRVFATSGSTAPFHTGSHHLDRDERIADFQKINTYHVGLVPYLLDKLKKIPDGDGNVLDNSLIIYGSAMGNSNLHNHKRCPLFFMGHAGGVLKGNRHLARRGRHADGECDAGGAARPGRRHQPVRRQHEADGSERGAIVSLSIAALKACGRSQGFGATAVVSGFSRIAAVAAVHLAAASRQHRSLMRPRRVTSPR